MTQHAQTSILFFFFDLACWLRKSKLSELTTGWFATDDSLSRRLLVPVDASRVRLLVEARRVSAGRDGRLQVAVVWVGDEGA